MGQEDVKFSYDAAERKVMTKIAVRASKLLGYDRLTTMMDVNACHSNGNPLRLKELLDADDFNFIHDVGGIARHLDRKTGKLRNCFSPRFSDNSLVEAA